MVAGNKRVAILLEQQYQDLEAWYPYYRLEEHGTEVVFVAPRKGIEYKGKYGYPAVSDMGIDEVNPADFDVVIIPGGFAPDFMRREPLMIAFVKTMYQSGKLVASICHGGWMLASAGIVKDKKVTCFSAIKDDLVNAGGNYLDQEVVVDLPLITSRGPDDLPSFCREIIVAIS